ncbi:hypothetical protein BT63DRAFT_443501 [Microthyrium microscopicum]|uniref:Uncharacterized protein n=1 Tax=Microthyrium microscopicum TaxID=703497 RepID=A0A6A6U0W7_9PEZI|nr:hypothetical protein BT63DRAFT_443501 [Microthyrium microscopicum]
MASRILTANLRLASRTVPRRTFATSQSLREPVVEALPAKRPVGAFRGGLTGFLLGSTMSGAGMYYYVMNEYRVSNELLTEDIFNLQATVQRLETHVKGIEEALPKK